MTNADIVWWLKWHNAHAYMIWGGLVTLAIGGRLVRRQRRREKQPP